MATKTPKEQKASGMKDKAKGRAKEAAGAATGSTKKRAEGVKDQVKGEAKKQAGKAREAAKKKR